MAKKKGLSFYQKKRKMPSGLFGYFLSVLFGMFAVTFIAVVLNFFLGTYTYVVGGSMEPGLHNGQRVYIDRFSYLLGSPKPGDVVVFMPKGNRNTHYYVKRVVAGPGDRVYISEGYCYVNGERTTKVVAKLQDAGIAENEITLGVDEYFCLGDLPQGSEDSRSANVGPVKKDDIVGRAWYGAKYEELPGGFVSSEVAFTGEIE